MSSRKKSARIAQRIKGVRLEKGRTQQAFATVLGVRQSLVSAWERGLLPSAENYVALGNVAEKHEDRMFFWSLAGMDRNAFLSALSTQEKKMHVDFDASEAVLIEPLQETDGESPPLKFPRWMVGRSLTIRYARVKDDFMVPLYGLGDIFLIDIEQVDPCSLERGSCVAIYHSPDISPEHLLVSQSEAEKLQGREEVARLRETGSFPFMHMGLFVGWVRKNVHPEFIQVFVDAPRRMNITVSEGFGGWSKSLESLKNVTRLPMNPRFVGRVIAWISDPEKLPDKPKGK
jgi:transcriptional regulator with XRE-family HTH domain